MDEGAFLRAVADAPEDGAPRLVYSDWLEERNELGDLPERTYPASFDAAGWKAFEKRAGQEYDRLTRVSFETFSNRAGWARAERPAEPGPPADRPRD